MQIGLSGAAAMSAVLRLPRADRRFLVRWTYPKIAPGVAEHDCP